MGHLEAITAQSEVSYFNLSRMWNVKRKVQTFSTTGGFFLEGARISAKLKIKIFTPNVYTWNVGLGADGMKWVWGKLQVVTGIIYHKTDVE